MLWSVWYLLHHELVIVDLDYGTIVAMEMNLFSLSFARTCKNVLRLALLTF